MEQRRYDELTVSFLDSNADLGEAVAEAFAEAVNRETSRRDSIAVIFATGNSQLSFVQSVVERKDIDWSRITALHMDEYLGMPEDHPSSFRRWMHEKIVDRVPVRGFNGMRGDHSPIEEELERYSELLEHLAPAITVMGIGENGHLAFNDPPADFETSDRIRVVTLDEASRRQQVGEGHFPSIEQAPRRAVSLTIPALLAANTVLVAVPESRKAAAVKATLEGPIGPQCPASILRRTEGAQVFLDRESAAQLS